MNARGEATQSLWMRLQVAPDAPSLAEDLRCDTVVGAGIAGLSTAYELAQEGQSVVVLDRGAIASGITARTTAHLAPICDDGMSELIKLRGEEIARLFHRSQEAAVDRIEQVVATHAIACEFRRLDAFLFPAMGMAPEDAQRQADAEFEAAGKLGVAAERASGVPLKGFEKSVALRYPAQATFHPLKYLKGVVAEIGKAGGRLFADTVVTEVVETDGGVQVRTDGGHTVTAANAVVATNWPIIDAALPGTMKPWRTYAMAFTIPRGTLPDALYWDMADPYHYVRLSPGPGGTDYLIAGGADHPTGEADDGSVRFEAIEAWIRQLVPSLGRAVHRWSGQVLDTSDYCGVIGRSSPRIFIASGDSGQGMTHGALAGLLLRDLILRGESPWEAVYDPARVTTQGLLAKAARPFEAVQQVAETLLSADVASVEELRPGQGGLLRQGLGTVAVCRDRDGTLHRLDSACTRDGGTLRWNTVEQCWDCPADGSHFAPDGAVLNGPAIAPLAAAD